MSRPETPRLRGRCNDALKAAERRRIRKERLQELAYRHGVELPPMPAGNVSAIHDAEQALVLAGVDPGDWDPKAVEA